MTNDQLHSILLMSIRITWLLLLLWMPASVAQTQRVSKPVPVIFDTDMGPDYDDVGAMAVLHALARSGQANILATIASTKHPRVGPVLSVLNTYFGRPGIPIGVPKGPALTDADAQHWSDTLVARYPHALKTNDDAPDAVAVYRRILAAQPNGSVTVVTVGFFTNLAGLLRSGPDRISVLTGQELVRRKVKQLVSMAGKFPTGGEFNILKDTASAHVVFRGWPTPILFSGFEIGEKIRTGRPLVQNPAILRSPVKDVFRISMPLNKSDSAGRMSWDQTAVLVAIQPYTPYYTVRKGRILLQPNGSTTWDDTGREHAYLVAQLPPEYVQRLLDHLMQEQPAPRRRAVPKPE